VAEQVSAASLLDAARDEAEAPPHFTEFEAFRVLSRHLSAFSSLVLGNSLPVRVADEMLARCNSPCVSQRGLNGIDGLLSLGAGAASVSEGRTLLVVGDITALHDLSGLDGVARSNPNLTILILNNQGGRIFECLPIGASAAAASPKAALETIDAWTTPHAADFCAVFRGLSIPSYLAQSAEQLDALLLEAAQNNGTRMLEARVAPGAARRYFASVKQRLRDTLRGEHFAARPRTETAGSSPGKTQR
jgi:2-succinyl-5-enolpyruvyl-6-hydroxy-3-cyclohexene-1-carboxylate synthase